jgi:hypothetical protein
VYSDLWETVIRVMHSRQWGEPVLARINSFSSQTPLSEPLRHTELKRFGDYPTELKPEPAPQLRALPG